MAHAPFGEDTQAISSKSQQTQVLLFCSFSYVHDPLLKMIWRRNFSLFIPFALSFFWLSQSVSAALLAIDYGTEWTKASLIKPGVPFDVLLNKDSKRKIHSSVAWKGDDRLFGSDAFNLVSEQNASTPRFPSDQSLFRLHDSLRTRSRFLSFSKELHMSPNF